MRPPAPSGRFPHWVHQHPERTFCFQNDHLTRRPTGCPVSP
ncbi:phenolic acid decarboxylase [Streptomyces tubercidicus]